MEEEHTTKDGPEMEGSPQDQDDMTRMGKIQEFKVLRGSPRCKLDIIN